MHIYNNSVLHYLYNMAVGLVIYSKARAYKAKANANANAKSSMPRLENRKAKAKKFILRPRPRINIPEYRMFNLLNFHDNRYGL